MKKILFLFLISFQLTSCENNKPMEEQFEWGAGISTAVGFPMRIYAGMVGENIISTEFTGSFDKPDDGWGVGYKEDSSMRYLPKNIDIAWLSYVEDCYYRVRADLDYPRLLKLFREGYRERVMNLSINPQGYMEQNFDTFIVGLAPGGVVVVWVEGPKRQIELGRFQAEKIDIIQPAGLDSHERVFFSKKDREETLADERYRPKHIREKPVPYGLWDEYRDTQYSWYPTFEFYAGAKMGDIWIQYHNHEQREIFYDNFTLETPARKDYSSDEITLIPDIFYQKGEDISDKKYPLPKSIRFIYKANNGIKYWGNYEFDWEETKETFAKFFAKYPNTRARLNIRVNKDNSLFTIYLENEEGEGFLIPFHRKKLYLGDTYDEYPTLD